VFPVGPLPFIQYWYSRSHVVRGTGVHAMFLYVGPGEIGIATDEGKNAARTISAFGWLPPANAKVFAPNVRPATTKPIAKIFVFISLLLSESARACVADPFVRAKDYERPRHVHRTQRAQAAGRINPQEKWPDNGSLSITCRATTSALPDSDSALDWSRLTRF
jgi:hypothetical protein